MNADEIIAIVPAAGSSSRMGLGKSQPPKILHKFSDGESVLEKSLLCLNQANIDKVVIATSTNIIDDVKSIVNSKISKSQNWKMIEVIEGGSTRFESVKKSLNYISSNFPNNSIKIVTIHDAARPFCDPKNIINSLQKVNDNTGVVLGVPVVNTIKVVESNLLVKQTLDRNLLYEIQTPQSFPFRSLLEAYRNSSENTHFDDSQVFEKFGGKVIVSESTRNNLKLTFSSDLPYFEYLANLNKK